MKIKKPKRAPDVELHANDEHNSEDVHIWFKEGCLFSTFTTDRKDFYRYKIERWVSRDQKIIWTQQSEDDDNIHILSNAEFWLFNDFNSKIEKSYQEYLAREALEKAIEGGE